MTSARIRAITNSDQKRPLTSASLEAEYSISSQFSSLLRDPVAVMMVGDASQIDLSGANVNEKENS